MHQLLHVAILAATLTAAAGLAMLLLWPVVFDAPLPPWTRAALLALVGLGAILFLLEWLVVH